VAVLAAACAAPAETPASASDAAPASLVLGVAVHGALVERLAELRVLVELSGERELVADVRPAAEAPLAWPVEALAAGERVRATVTGYDGAGALVVAVATTTVTAAARTPLLHAALLDACALDHPDADAWCAPWACADGPSDAAFVPPGLLADHHADWWRASSSPGCATAEPALRIGRPDPPFEPLETGSTVPAEYGIQGGSHIWVSLAMRGLDPERSVAGLVALFEETGAGGPLQKLVQPFQHDADGCVAYRARYLLPISGAHDVAARIGASVVDASGRAAHDHVAVFIAAPTEPPPH
jgi:hypothetical protein